MGGLAFVEANARINGSSDEVDNFRLQLSKVTKNNGKISKKCYPKILWVGGGHLKLYPFYFVLHIVRIVQSFEFVGPNTGPFYCNIIMNIMAILTLNLNH